MRRIWSGLLIFGGLVIVISLVVMLLIRITPKPPVAKIELARIALSEAGKNKAETFSRKLYTEATASYDSAMVNWERQNNRFIFFRDYSKVIVFAELSVKQTRLLKTP
jgi:hypothetical protein